MLVAPFALASSINFCAVDIVVERFLRKSGSRKASVTPRVAFTNRWISFTAIAAVMKSECEGYEVVETSSARRTNSSASAAAVSLLEVRKIDSCARPRGSLVNPEKL